MIIAIDFDGTIVTHEYPRIGQPVPGALETMKELQEAGHVLILWTMRSGDKLMEAKSYLLDNGFNLMLNHNPDQISWTESPKLYGNLYIDDAALGCPLEHDPSWCLTARPYVDWGKVRLLLVQTNVLSP